MKNVDNLQNELLDRACNLLSQPTVTQPIIHPLALVWTEKLTELTPIQRLHAEKAINDILYEAQLNNLNKNSVQINNYVATSSPAPSTSNLYTPSPLDYSAEVHLAEENYPVVHIPEMNAINLPEAAQQKLSSLSHNIVQASEGLASQIILHRPQRLSSSTRVVNASEGLTSDIIHHPQQTYLVDTPDSHVVYGAGELFAKFKAQY